MVSCAALQYVMHSCALLQYFKERCAVMSMEGICCLIAFAASRFEIVVCLCVRFIFCRLCSLRMGMSSVRCSFEKTVMS